MVCVMLTGRSASSTWTGREGRVANCRGQIRGKREKAGRGRLKDNRQRAKEKEEIDSCGSANREWTRDEGEVCGRWKMKQKQKRSTEHSLQRR